MQKWFDPSTVRVTVIGLAPRTFESEVLAWLSGAPAGSEVVVTFGGAGLTLKVLHPSVRQMQRTLFFDLDSSQWMLHNDEIHVLHPGSNFLAKSLFSQASAAREVGIRQIRATAVGDIETALRPATEQLIGYWQLPRLGFDCRLSQDMKRSIPGGQAFNTLLALTESELGRAWWKQWGRKARVVFNTESGSASWVRLIRYMVEHKLEM